jgi:bacterial/archaeal transporter family-2 protein
MSRGVAVVLVAVAGCLVGMQAPVNARLGRGVGNLQAAAFSFVVGTAALVLIAALSKGGLGSYANLGKLPWWALVGGLFGAVYVTVSILAVRKLGVSGLTATVIAGQLGIAVVIDRLGWFGIERQSIAATRIIGLLLLAVGVFLVVRR